MTIFIEEAILAVESEGFKRTHETKKVAEHESERSGRIHYLRLEQGFTRHADIVINPEVTLAKLITIPEVGIIEHSKLRFGSNMKKFPKAMNEGKNQNIMVELCMRSPQIP